MVFGYTIIPMALFSLLFSVSVVSNRPKMQMHPRTEDRDDECRSLKRYLPNDEKSTPFQAKPEPSCAGCAYHNLYEYLQSSFLIFNTKTAIIQRRFRVAGLHVQLRVLQNHSLRRLILWSLFSGTSALSCNAVYFVVP